MTFGLKDFFSKPIVAGFIGLFGSALYLVVPAIIITAVSILVFKTEFYEDVLALKNYYDKIYKTRK